jgi:hypothetical protein
MQSHEGKERAEGHDQGQYQKYGRAQDLGPDGNAKAPGRRCRVSERQDEPEGIPHLGQKHEAEEHHRDESQHVAP